MFPRAARFNAERLSDTPGPNAYDPTEMVAHYKRGLLNQKDARFKAGDDHGSEDGPSTSAATTAHPHRQAGSSAKDCSSNGALQKEKAKWAAKLAKAEERASVLEQQSHTLANDKSQALADLRISQQQVEKLHAQIAKVKGQAAKSDSSQTKLLELQRVHDQGKARQRADEEKWVSKLRTTQGERDQLSTGLAKTRALLAAKETEVHSLQRVEDGLQRRLAEESSGRLQAEKKVQDLLTRGREREESIEGLQQEQEQATLDSRRLQSSIEDIREELLEQQRQRNALEWVARESGQKVCQLFDQVQEMSQARSVAKMEKRRMDAELESRDREVAFLRETAESLENELREERERYEEACLDMDGALQQHRVSGLEDVESEDGGDWTWGSERVVMEESAHVLERLSQMALQDEEEKSQSLEAAMEALHGEYLEALKENATLEETRRALSKARQELESVEEAYEKGVLEVMRAHEGEEEVKRELSQSRAENTGLASKLVQFEAISKKIFHAKVKEQAWLQEREELLSELERNSHYEGEYRTLRSQAQLLVSKSTSYEAQMDELHSLNVVLASHSNPCQKIFYVDRIRKELDERRNECQSLVVQRDELQTACKDLQHRLDLFCKVDSRLEDRPRTAFKRVVRQSYREAAPVILAERALNRSAYGRDHRRSPGKGNEGDMTVEDLITSE